MLSPPLGIALLALATASTALLPEDPGLVVGLAVAAAGAIVLVAVAYRRAPDVPAVWVAATVAAIPLLAWPVAVRDTVLDLAGRDVPCTVRTVEYVPERGTGRYRSAAENRWVVDCPSGPVGFTGARGALDPVSPTVVLRADPVDVLEPRPEALLVPWWFRAIPPVASLALAALLAAASHVDRTRHL